MNLYKTVTGLISVFLFLIFVSNASAQESLPHFFPEGVKKVANGAAADQWEEWMRYANATAVSLANSQARSFIIGKSRFVEKTYFGQKVKIVFDQHVCENINSLDENGKCKNGDRTRYTSFGGQYYLTEKQFQDLVDYIDKNIVMAVEFDYGFWSKAEPEAVRIAAKSSQMSEKEFREYLDREDPLHPGMTFRDIRHIPKPLERKDFIPFRELHIGLSPEIPTVLGVAWLNTGVVYYTPVGMIRDYLTGTPVVLAHEFVHNNKKLQGIPLVWGFDAEVMASVPDMLSSEDYLDIYDHQYAADIRELFWVFYRFDFEQARKQVVRISLVGNLVIDRQRFDENSRKLELAKAEFRKAAQKIVAEFYSNPIWWTGLNDKLVDDNSVFRVMMSSMYNPTLLGGEEATTKWRIANDEKIRKWADEAFNESGSTANNAGIENINSISLEDKENRKAKIVFSQIQTVYRISNEDIAMFLRFYKTTPQEVLKWEPKKLRESIEAFIVNERTKRRERQ